MAKRRNRSHSKKKGRGGIIALCVILGVVAIGLGLYFGVPEVKEAINGIFSKSEEIADSTEEVVSFLAR